MVGVGRWASGLALIIFLLGERIFVLYFFTFSAIFRNSINVTLIGKPSTGSEGSESPKSLI